MKPELCPVPVIVQSTVHRSPFTVRRSPFAVRRSPFAVHRAFAGPWRWRHAAFTTTRTPANLNPFRILRSLRLRGEIPVPGLALIAEAAFVSYASWPLLAWHR